MAWHKHKIKRIKQSRKAHLRNMSAKKEIKKVTKNILALVKGKKKDDAQVSLKKAASTYASCAKRGIIHRKNASRHISRLTKKVSALVSVEA